MRAQDEHSEDDDDDAHVGDTGSDKLVEPDAAALACDERDERARRAITLYLQGRRVAEIAAELTVSATTVRRWTRDALMSLAAEERAVRATQLARAIASQQAVASAAWEAYERERQLDEALLRGELDHVRRRAIRGRRPTALDADGGTGDDDALCPPLAMEEYERPKRTAQGARYLSVALAAQREVARLQGLYARLEEAERDVRITISRRPDGPENRPPTHDGKQGESEGQAAQESQEAQSDEQGK